MMTKTLADYMNDPDIIDEPKPLREVHAIRLLHYDEMRGMSAQEKTDFINKRASAVVEKYGFKVAQKA